MVHSGTTPATVTLKSGAGYIDGAEYTIAFKKDGYETRQITLYSSLSGWHWENILFGGVIGLLIVDPLTGAMYKLPEEATLNVGDNVVGQAAGKRPHAADDLSSARGPAGRTDQDQLKRKGRESGLFYLPRGQAWYCAESSCTASKKAPAWAGSTSGVMP